MRSQCIMNERSKKIFLQGEMLFEIQRPFTLRELSGPWSWVAIRYYWFTYDLLMLDVYRAYADAGGDPAKDILLPEVRRIAGNVELVLEKTPLALKFSRAESGSVKLFVNGVWQALDWLWKWLPAYGKWLQEKGQIDINLNPA